MQYQDPSPDPDSTEHAHRSLAEPRPAELDDVAARLLAALASASSVDLAPYRHASCADLLEREVADLLGDLVSTASHHIGRLELLVGEIACEAPVEDPWRRVADLCFLTRGEIGRAARALARIRWSDHGESLDACEGARRKLRRALVAVLGALGRARGRDFAELAVAIDDETERACAVRQVYAKFRRSLPSCDSSDSGQVRRALRYASVSIAVMVGDESFGDVRARDRALILQLQDRVLRWARAGSNLDEGASLYRDVAAAADLLRAINLRQELAVHDRGAARDAIRALAGDDPEAAVAAATPALRALRGRDDALDDLIDRASRGPAGPTLVDEICRAIRVVAEDLDGVDHRGSL